MPQQPPSFCFPGRTMCLICGLPVPEAQAEQGVCLSCQQPLQDARTLAVLTSPAPTTVSKFHAAIAEIRRSGTPHVTTIADTLMEALGGPTGFVERLVEDFRSVRGENKAEELRQFHDVDFKTLKGFYEAILRLVQSRDEIVGSTDPLEGMNEDELLQVASQAAMLRVSGDADFRRQMLLHCGEVDPDMLIEVAASFVK